MKISPNALENITLLKLTTFAHHVSTKGQTTQLHWPTCTLAADSEGTCVKSNLELVSTYIARPHAKEATLATQGADQTPQEIDWHEGDLTPIFVSQVLQVRAGSMTRNGSKVVHHIHKPNAHNANSVRYAQEFMEVCLSIET
eukprot:5178189-Amphidinium_carterae.1